MVVAQIDVSDRTQSHALSLCSGADPTTSRTARLRDAACRQTCSAPHMWRSCRSALASKSATRCAPRLAVPLLLLWLDALPLHVAQLPPVAATRAAREPAAHLLVTHTPVCAKIRPATCAQICEHDFRLASRAQSHASCLASNSRCANVTRASTRAAHCPRLRSAPK